MNHLSFPILTTLLAATALSWTGFSQNQGAAPAPKTLPGAVTEIYKTVGDVELPIHIYYPEDHKPNDNRPAIVFFFGGGWRSGSPAQFQNQCAYLASRGMVSMTAEYRVSSRHRVKAVSCIMDAKSAIRWARQNANRLGIDPNRLASGGGSAGGHLAGATGTIAKYDDPQDDTSISAVPNALCLFNPALVMAPVEGQPPIPEKRLADLKQRIGVPLESFSPYHNVASGQPPAIIFHGTADKTVSHQSVELFAQKSQSKGNRCELVSYEGQGHGFFNYKPENTDMFVATVAEMDQFLVSLGYLKGKPSIQRFSESIK